MKLKSAALAIGATATLTAGSALAAFVPLPAGIAVMEDDNIEYAIRGDSILTDPGATLQVGDRLRAVITFAAIKDGANNTFTTLKGDGPPPPSLELTGISEIQLKAIVGGTLFFGPSASFEAVYGAGAMAALFSETPGNFLTSCNAMGVGNCEGRATDGALWLVTGFGDADDFWFATSTLPVGGLDSVSLGFVAGLAPTFKFGAANYALSVLQNNTGYQLDEQFSVLSAIVAPGGDGFTDLLGSGDLLGGSGLTGPFFARSDFDFQLNVVPEPGVLALLGLGLAGLGLATRRRLNVA